MKGFVHGNVVHEENMEKNLGGNSILGGKNLSTYITIFHLVLYMLCNYVYY